MMSTNSPGMCRCAQQVRHGDHPCAVSVFPGAVLDITLLQSGGPLEMWELAAGQQGALRSRQDIRLGLQGAGVVDRMGSAPVDSRRGDSNTQPSQLCATCQRRCTGDEG